MSPTATGVPVIDISGLRGAGRSEIVGALTRAHRALGFSQIVEHGIPGEVLDALFDASRAFQALPLKKRRQLALDHLHRGFIEIDTSVDRHSSIETATRPNQSESFMVMREAGPDDPEVVAGTLLAGPNQWPDLPGFRAAVEHYQRCVEAVATDVLDGPLSRDTALRAPWIISGVIHIGLLVVVLRRLSTAALDSIRSPEAEA